MIPKHRWPNAWHGKFFQPADPQILNVNGHPEAGAIWEEHLGSITWDTGFEQIDNHRACDWHPQLHVMVVVYVDDIKLAGPAAACDKVWSMLRKKVLMDDPTPPDRFF